MKDVMLKDPYRTMTIRMCEKHFSRYRSQLDRAMSGGTAYTFVSTDKRGCEICKKERGDK